MVLIAKKDMRDYIDVLNTGNQEFIRSRLIPALSKKAGAWADLRRSEHEFRSINVRLTGRLGSYSLYLTHSVNQRYVVCSES